MKILVIGGCGYIGTVLVEKLIMLNHAVTVFDTEWFGNYHRANKNLNFKKKDVRDISPSDLKDYDSVIHLANIANDPSVELNPNLSWEVNVLASNLLMQCLKKTKVKHIIYASSGSVYGVKTEEHVTEDLDLVPISTYNKTKMISERVLLSYKDDFKIHCIRPATVCGFSPRMRLDVTVNMLTFQALKKKTMTVYGGTQIRPNIHIQDLSEVFIHFLDNPDIESGAYNAGFENLSILDIANIINSKINSKIEIFPTKDIRSYRQNSDKLLKTGFKKKFGVNKAIDEIIEKYNQGLIIEKESCYTVNWMKKMKL
jgi:nucleoside-diphosphate-sugar epimerase